MEVVIDLPPGLAPVHGDADQLHQVVVNLVVNAQQALIGRPAPRRLAVRAWAEGGEAVLEVADNGPGMDPDMAKRAFEPFFTTKPQGVGTGVGLSVCHGIVAAHGGRIELDTDARRGRAVPRPPAALRRRPARCRAERRRSPLARRARAGGRRRAGDRGALEGAARRGRPDASPPRRAAGGRWRRWRPAASTRWSATSGCPTWTARRWPRRSAGAGPALADRILLITGDALGADPGGRLGARGAADLREAARPRARWPPSCAAGWPGSRRNEPGRAHPGGGRRARPAGAARGLSRHAGLRGRAPPPTPPSSTPGWPRRRPT